MTGPHVAPGASGVATAPGDRGDEVAEGRLVTAIASGEAGVALAPGRIPTPRQRLVIAVSAVHGLALGHSVGADSGSLINTTVAHGLRLAHAVEIAVNDPPSAEVSVS